MTYGPNDPKPQGGIGPTTPRTTTLGNTPEEAKAVRARWTAYWAAMGRVVPIVLAPSNKEF